MESTRTARQHLDRWSTVLGRRPALAPELEGRGVWPVIGENGRRFVLKHVGPWRNLPLRDQHRVLQHLARHGVQVADMLPTDDGRIHAGSADSSFLLLPYIEHDAPSPTPTAGDCRIVGRSVAALHHALAAYPRSANSSEESFLESLAGELDLPAELGSLLAPRVPRWIETLQDLPIQLVHGDLTPDNVLIDAAEGRAAFIDLDHLPRAPRIWDLARYLSRIFRRSPAEVALSRTAVLVESYRRASALSAAETSGIPAMIATMHVLEADWTRRIIRGELDRPLLPAQRAELGPVLDALAWLMENEDLIAEAVAPPARPLR